MIATTSDSFRSVMFHDALAPHSDVITTHERSLRIRIRTRPDPVEFGDFGVQYFRVGEVYDVSSTLGSLLVIAGHAEPVVGADGRADADSRPMQRRPKI